MSDINRRLNAMEKVWQRPAAERPLWEIRAEEAAAESAESIALGRHVFARTLRRYLFEHGTHAQRPDVDSPEFFERERRELTDLIRHQEALGVEAGWDAWLAEGADWPQLAGQPNDAESYAEDVKYWTWSQEQLRARIGYQQEARP